MSSFTITTPETSLNLRPSTVKAGETASTTATYTVTNRTGSTKSVRLKVEPLGNTDASWFTVRDGDEREIAPGQTAAFSVDLAVPGGDPGQSFEAVAINLEDPDNDFERGSAISFNAPALENGGGWECGGLCKALIGVGVLAVVVIAGFVIYLALKDSKPEMVANQDFVGSELAFARAVSGDVGYQLEVTEKTPNETACSTEFYTQVVVEQSPTAEDSAEVPEGSTVKVIWAWQPKELDVPPIRHMNFLNAVGRIKAEGFRVGSYLEPTGAEPEPTRLHYPAVKSWQPNQKAPACTEIDFDMAWRRTTRFQDAQKWQSEFENAVINRADLVAPRPPILITE